MIEAILLSMVVASISFFLVHSQLLNKQRKWIQERSEFLATLLDCCYCLGFWVAVVVLVIFPTKLFGIYAPADYVLTWMVINWMASLQTLAASWLWGE